MLAIAQTHVRPPAATLSARRSRRLVVTANRSEGSGNKGRSGVHDPIGWGQRGGAVKPHEAALEQQRHLQAEHLASQQERSNQAAHPGGVGVDRYQAAQRELKEVEQEKTVIREQSASDDEWEHMPAPKKWYMEAKALLYSWLGTGVEPL